MLILHKKCMFLPAGVVSVLHSQVVKRKASRPGHLYLRCQQAGNANKMDFEGKARGYKAGYSPFLSRSRREERDPYKFYIRSGNTSQPKKICICNSLLYLYIHNLHDRTVHFRLQLEKHLATR
jgi:hypothetical protein